MSILLNLGTMPKGLAVKTYGIFPMLGFTTDVVQIGEFEIEVDKILDRALVYLIQRKKYLVLGNYYISQLDVFALLYYIVTNTNLTEDDPREKFVKIAMELEPHEKNMRQFLDCMKAMKKVDGFRSDFVEGKKERFATNVLPYILNAPSEN